MKHRTASEVDAARETTLSFRDHREPSRTATRRRGWPAAAARTGGILRRADGASRHYQQHHDGLGLTLGAVVFRAAACPLSRDKDDGMTTVPLDEQDVSEILERAARESLRARVVEILLQQQLVYAHTPTFTGKDEETREEVLRVLARVLDMVSNTELQ